MVARLIHESGARLDPPKLVGITIILILADVCHYNTAPLTRRKTYNPIPERDLLSKDIPRVMACRGTKDKVIAIDHTESYSLHLQSLYCLNENTLVNILHAQGYVHRGRALGQRGHYTRLALTLGIKPRV